jgi:hypothetical protein
VARSYSVDTTPSLAEKLGEEAWGFATIKVSTKKCAYHQKKFYFVGLLGVKYAFCLHCGHANTTHLSGNVFCNRSKRLGELFSNDDRSCDISLALTGKITGTTGM